jgi:hypothetical protein
MFLRNVGAFSEPYGVTSQETVIFCRFIICKRTLHQVDYYYYSIIIIILPCFVLCVCTISFITYNFSSLDCLRVLHTAFVRSNLEYASAPWNNLTLSDSNKLGNMQRKFVNLCYNRFIQSNCLRNYELILNHLHL